MVSTAGENRFLLLATSSERIALGSRCSAQFLGFQVPGAVADPLPILFCGMDVRCRLGTPPSFLLSPNPAGTPRSIFADSVRRGCREPETRSWQRVCFRRNHHVACCIIRARPLEASPYVFLVWDITTRAHQQRSPTARRHKLLPFLTPDSGVIVASKDLKRGKTNNPNPNAPTTTSFRGEGRRRRALNSNCRRVCCEQHTTAHLLGRTSGK